MLISMEFCCSQGGLNATEEFLRLGTSLLLLSEFSSCNNFRSHFFFLSFLPGFLFPGRVKSHRVDILEKKFLDLNICDWSANEDLVFIDTVFAPLFNQSCAHVDNPSLWPFGFRWVQFWRGQAVRFASHPTVAPETFDSFEKSSNLLATRNLFSNW